jgi:small subunit ribosomal protein S8
MPVTDQISDFLTRIRNAGSAGHKNVESPANKVKKGMAEILKDQGFIQDYEIVKSDIQDTIVVTLKYYKREPVIKTIRRVSKPGRRVYSSCEKLPRVNNGLGIAIISTSKGVMTSKQAKKFNVGGEVLCTVW